jgi:hypothetical protein
MSAEQAKSLMEKRAELEKQLQSLTDRGGALYTPGIRRTLADRRADVPSDRRAAGGHRGNRRSPQGRRVVYGATLNGGALGVATRAPGLDASASV